MTGAAGHETVSTSSSSSSSSCVRGYLKLPTLNVERGGRVRLLALHSFRTSAKIFMQQMARAGWMMDEAKGTESDGSGVGTCYAPEIVFLDAPFVATKSPGAKIEQFFPGGPYREWWNASDDGLVYHGLEETLKYVNAFATREGPFHGVIGFSQGGSLAALLCALQQERRCVAASGASTPQDDAWPALTFDDFQACICICGLTTRPKALQRFYRDKFEVPSMHFLGSADSLTPFSRRLVANFELADVVEHSYGHVVPSLAAADARERLAVFLKKHCCAKTSGASHSHEATPSL